MYDILELKSKLLTDLQDIAKNLNVPKYRSLKKMDLIYQILDVQAINPKATKENKQGEKIKFFNMGAQNDWKKFLDPKIKENLEREFVNEMKELNYL